MLPRGSKTGARRTLSHSGRLIARPAALFAVCSFAALAVAIVMGVVVLAYSVRIARLERAKTTREEYSRRFIELQEHDRKRIASEAPRSTSNPCRGRGRAFESTYA